MATLETERSPIEQAMPTARPAICRAWSAARNTARVIEELTAGIANCDPALITVFVSSNLPYEDIVAPLSAIYPEVPLVGCTTAGSLTCDSYEADGSIAIAFDRAAFSFETCLLTALRRYSMAQGGEAIEAAYFRLLRTLDPERANYFALLLVAGREVGRE